jgi:hypothetical protein
MGMVDTTERPPFVRFERRGVEDRNASLDQGRYVEKDVDMALVTPPGSRDIMVHSVEDWMKGLRRGVEESRLPQSWFDRYRAQYESWRKGEELPVNGSPIKGWGVLSPAQQKNLIGLNILTVEDLAALNDEGVRRVGMGGVDLKNKANAWLRQLEDKGLLTQEHAALKAENVALKDQMEALSKQVEMLMQGAKVQAQAVVTEGFLDDEDSLRNQYIAKFGKAPHHAMKRETIIEKLGG